jgi:cytochrome c peroxidase
LINNASAINPFADIPALEHPGHTDLGLWNVFLNPEFPRPQEKLMAMMHHDHPGVTDTQALLDLCVAAFKTAGLRDLGHSDPYFHTGRFKGLESAVHFYRQFSELARHGGVRNADPELLGVHIAPEDEPKLVAFLHALNEDYE